MTEPVHAYREELIQWVWQHREFNCQNLKTRCGKKLTIFDPGELNHGAGPDFTGAHIEADNIQWHGSVEIHKSSDGWNAHQHEKDENFNSVILHVVYCDDSRKKIITSDGAEPLVLELKPYLHKSLAQLLELRHSDGLACGGKVAFINQDAFEAQIKKAHKEYFNYKIDELLEEYKPSLKVSEAWRTCLIIQLYKTLGIPANRKQMGLLAKRLVTENTIPETPKLFLKNANRIAFDNRPDSKIHWIQSGMRPASRPSVRIEQAAALHFSLLDMDFRQFLSDPKDSWKAVISAVSKEKLPGSTRLNLIKQTVYLPAVYLLGDLLQSKTLKTKAFSYWQSGPQKIPREVQIPFTNAGFEVNRQIKKLGLAHQYKRYCNEHNCHRCEVFKSAIRS